MKYNQVFYKNISEVLLNILQPEHPGSSKVIDIEFDDITMQTKLVLRPGIKTRRFDEKSFFNIILGFNGHWAYKHYNEYISQKIINLSTTNKIHLKGDVIDGSLIDSLRWPLLFSFALDKPTGYRVF